MLQYYIVLNVMFASLYSNKPVLNPVQSGQPICHILYIPIILKKPFTRKLILKLDFM